MPPSNYEIVIFVVLAWIMLARLSKAYQKLGENAKRKKKDAEVNRQVGLSAQQAREPFADPGAAGSRPQNRPMPANRPAASAGSASSPINYPSAVPGGATQRKNARPQMPVKPAQNTQTNAPAGEDEKATTEMLAKKAKQDQIEHQREKLEQKRHEQKYYSNFNYAKRYLLGDEISPSEKMIFCPNCAAENLIKIHENPKKYNCYFCREKLE